MKNAIVRFAKAYYQINLNIWNAIKVPMEFYVFRLFIGLACIGFACWLTTRLDGIEGFIIPGIYSLGGGFMISSWND